MRVEFSVGTAKYEADLGLPRGQIFVGSPPVAREIPIEDAVSDALERPVGLAPLRTLRLRDKRVVLIVDDMDRPTPAYRLAAPVIKALSAAGVERRAISFVVACGLHQTIPPEKLEQKLGKDILRDYEVHAHNAFADDLALKGYTVFGTPVYVNRHVAEADMRIALGRVSTHTTHGYEGGAKMILPGVSGWMTITHMHSMNFADGTGPGHHCGSPVRIDTNSAGIKAGLDYIVNIVTDHVGHCYGAFAGHLIRAHHAAVEFGDAMVWGIRLPRLFDVVIAGPGAAVGGALDGWTLLNAARALKPGGTLIILGEGAAKPHSLGSGLSIDQIAVEHERRNREGSLADACRYVKRIRGDFPALRICTQNHVIYVNPNDQPELAGRYGMTQARDLQSAVGIAIERHGPGCTVACLPDSNMGLPLLQFHRADLMDRSMELYLGAL